MADPNAILKAMMSGQGPGTTRELIEAIGKDKNLSPKRRLLLQFLENYEQGRAFASSELGAATHETPGDPAEQHEERRRTTVRRIREIVVGLAEELAAVRQVNENLALALGACAECMGEDPSCPSCRGSGGPGTSDPHPGLYRRFVRPAVMRVQSRKRPGTKQSASTADDEDVSATDKATDEGDSNG